MMYLMPVLNLFFRNEAKWPQCFSSTVSVSHWLDETTRALSGLAVKSLQQSLHKRGESCDSNDNMNIASLVVNGSVTTFQNFWQLWVISAKIKRDISSQIFSAKYPLGFLQLLQLARYGDNWLHNQQVAL